MSGERDCFIVFEFVGSRELVKHVEIDKCPRDKKQNTNNGSLYILQSVESGEKFSHITLL